MKIQHLIRVVEDCGAWLSVSGDGDTRLQLHHASAVPPELIEDVRKHKNEIIHILSQRNDPKEIIHDLVMRLMEVQDNKQIKSLEDEAIERLKTEPLFLNDFLEASGKARRIIARQSRNVAHETHGTRQFSEKTA